MGDSIVSRIRAAVDRVLPADATALLAVSGGVDSMVLLDAAIHVRPLSRLRAATFDHGSGPHSVLARTLVETTARRLSLSLAVGHHAPGDRRPGEAAWRNARLAFLRAVAAETRAVPCTAHTRDDQVETVLFRALRGAGARGLAGLRAPGHAVRPLLAFTRRHVMDYAREAGVEWVEDPTNASRAFARNRLRLDLLPTLRAVHPSIEDELCAIGERAATWRAAVEAAVDREIPHAADPRRRVLEVRLSGLLGRSEDVLAIVWPALLGRIGIAVDWRGTHRLVEFTRKGRAGQCIQLSGGWEVRRRGEVFAVRQGIRAADSGDAPGLPFLSEHD